MDLVSAFPCLFVVVVCKACPGNRLLSFVISTEPRSLWPDLSGSAKRIVMDHRTTIGPYPFHSILQKINWIRILITVPDVPGSGWNDASEAHRERLFRRQNLNHGLLDSRFKRQALPVGTRGRWKAAVLCGCMWVQGETHGKIKFDQN